MHFKGCIGNSRKVPELLDEVLYDDIDFTGRSSAPVQHVFCFFWWCFMAFRFPKERHETVFQFGRNGRGLKVMPLEVWYFIDALFHDEMDGAASWHCIDDQFRLIDQMRLQDACGDAFFRKDIITAAVCDPAKILRRAIRQKIPLREDEDMLHISASFMYAVLTKMKGVLP